MAVCDIQSQTEILTSDAPIIAFTTSPKEEIVAYAQILSSVVIIAKFSLNEKVEVLSEIAIPGDVAIKDLVFSYDGRYLAILGDFPQTLISVWDWKSQEMIASAPNNSLASNIAFDPLDPMRLCISGKDGEAKFWDIKMGLHGYSLIQLMGARIGDSIFDDPWNFENKDSSQDTSHLDDKKYPIWGPDRNLISLNNDGSIAYSIDSQSGESNLLLETALLKKQMTCIALNKENFIAGTSDGNLLFFDHSGSYSKTLNIFNGTPILFLTFDPSFSKLLVESSEKQFVYDLGTTEILDLKLRQGVVGVSSDSLSISQLENAGPTSIKLAAEDLQSTEAVAFKSKMKAKLDDIIKSIADLVEANENVPEIERLDKSEFVIDLAERDRLLKETEVTILKMRKDQEGVNMTNRIIMNRIKKECWDSAEVVGRTIKSFKPSELLNDLVKVSNYPIRKRSEAEGARVANLKRLRRVELAVEQSLNINDERKVSVDLGSGVNGKLESKVLSENSKLLYSPSELNSKERQRLQSFILAEVVHDIKLSFNQLFNEIFKDKQDEIAKVEEKNERVKAILDELGVN